MNLKQGRSTIIRLSRFTNCAFIVSDVLKIPLGQHFSLNQLLFQRCLADLSPANWRCYWNKVLEMLLPVHTEHATATGMFRHPPSPITPRYHCFLYTFLHNSANIRQPEVWRADRQTDRQTGLDWTV